METKATSLTLIPIAPRPILAVFDFDKTMSDRHSFWRFMRFVVGPWKFYTVAIPLRRHFVGYYRRQLTLMQLRAAVIQYFFEGIPCPIFEKLARQFAEEQLPGWISEEALARLQWHQHQGHQTALVSNAAEDYLIPWAHRWGFAATVGSRFASQNGVLTGLLEGTHCYGPEKVRRLENEVGPLPQYELYVYGDSEGDKALLDIAQHPYYRSFRQETNFP